MKKRMVDITQKATIGKEYREGSMPLQVQCVERIDHHNKRYTTTHFSCDAHNTGTHIDVGSAEAVIALERFVAPGVKFDVSAIQDREITLADLDLSLVQEGAYIFFQTNWDAYIANDEKYLKHPEIAWEVITYLVSKKVNMIGIDAPGLARDKKHGIIDKYLAKEEKYTIENLTNLKDVPANQFKVYCMPMKIEGINAWPARLVVEIAEN